MKQSIAVYCASSSLVEDIYKNAAKETGAFLASQGHNIVYGGGHVGLMGIMADASLAGGAKVTGVITEQLMDLEVAHHGLTELHVTKTMQQRQNMMAELSDGFVILPGGLGTLAEFFEVLTWKQLGLHTKPIVILNVNGYWDGLHSMIGQAFETKFLRQNPHSLYQITQDYAEMNDFLVKSCN